MQKDQALRLVFFAAYISQPYYLQILIMTRGEHAEMNKKTNTVTLHDK